MILFDNWFQENCQCFSFAVHLKSVCNTSQPEVYPVLPEGCCISASLWVTQISLGTDQPTDPTKDPDSCIVQHSAVQVTLSPFGTDVRAGNINLLTWVRLSSHRGTSYPGKSHTANTQQIPGKRFWPACPPCIGLWWGQTSTQRVQAIVGGWSKAILFLFSSLSILQCISYFIFMAALGFSLGQSSGLPRHVTAAHAMVAPWWRWEGQSFPSWWQCSLQDHSGGLWGPPYVQNLTHNCRAQEGTYRDTPYVKTEHKFFRDGIWCTKP